MTRPRRTLLNAAHGFTDGAVATLPMSAFMLAAQRVGAMGRQPPARIAEAGLTAAGAGDAPPPARKLAGALLHFAFGGAAGALFAVWARTGRNRRRHAVSRRRAALWGAAFASGVWAASYVGWVPALGIMPPAHRDRPGRQPSLVVAHWIYGAALGWRTAARAA